jgi:flagellar protein FliS
MFGLASRGASTYAEVGIETGVVSASPHELVLMLFDGATTSVSTALLHMRRGNLEEKGHAISKAIAIIENGLRASLDKNVGGPMVQSLDSLYEYMTHRLCMANLKNQPEQLEEVCRLLCELKVAWASIGRTPQGISPQFPLSKTTATGRAIPPMKA